MSRRPHTPQSIAALVVIALLAVVGPQLFRHPRVNRVPDPSPPPAASPSAPTPTVTHPNIGFRSRANLEVHFKKHGPEFGPDTTIDSYLRTAQSLRDAPASDDILELKRPDNVTTRFDKRTGAFLAFNPDHTIRTFFRPTDGEQYFHRQADRDE